MQVCWKQLLWKDGVTASHLRMAAICRGSNKGSKKSVKLQAADGAVLKTPDILSVCHLRPAGKSEHLKITGHKDEKLKPRKGK